MVIVDVVSRFAFHEPTRRKTPAAVFKVLIERVVLVFGLFKNCITDRANNFSSKLSNLLYKRLGVRCRITRSKSPLSNGKCEHTY